MNKFIIWGILVISQCVLLFLGSFGVIGWPWPFILSPALLFIGLKCPSLFYGKRVYRVGMLVALGVGQSILFIIKFAAVEVLNWATVLMPLWLFLYLASFTVPTLLIAFLWKRNGRV